ncbi:hypothetical protein TWF506_010757 [Arthrobotrys conoides]|uniref:Mid2 domain-containing protein n=1 Tax=Arthrobotrys conoides TaxID=74498 RepID=A0AAN8NBH6_9PEZI
MRILAASQTCPYVFDFVACLFSIFAFFPTAQGISTLNAFTDANCVFRPRSPQPGHTDGECQSIVTPNTISVSIESLDPGCAVTIYADLYCSQEPIAKEINIGDCANLNGMLVRSFSVDGCPPGTPDYTDLLGSNSTTTSSSRIPSATSSNIPSSAPTQPSAPPASSESSNRTAIIGGAVGGGVGLFMVAVSLIGWFLYKRSSKNERIIETGWPDIPSGGYGRYTGDGGPGPSGYGTDGSYFGLNTPQDIGELEANNSSRTNINIGNTYFKGQSNPMIAQKRAGGGTRSASGSGIFENQVADDVPLREIPRQELEAPVPIQQSIRREQQKQQHSRTFSLGRERLPDMPRVPGVGE